MKTIIQNPKVIAATATVLLFVCAVWISSVHQVNGDLENNIKEERLKSEAYLSEKLSLDKEIAKMKNEFKSLVGKNADLDKAVFAANKKLDQKEVELSKIQRDNRSVKDMQKKHDELKKIKSDLDQEVVNLKNTIASLKKDNSDLNNSIALLESKNKNLAEQLNNIKLASIDDIRIEAVKRKSQQLTATAKKTKKVIVSFEVPAALQSELSYKITSPSGSLLTDKNGSITSSTMPDEMILTTSVNNVVTPKKKQIQMVYETKEKLQGGIYTIEVSSNGLYIGSLQVNLR